MEQYLQANEIIDWHHPAVMAKARQLAEGVEHLEAIARHCFEFVRDEIQHSWDYQRDETTCKASEVLEQGTGWCYAKSHLLAALLRANRIPAGLCYQRLTIDGDTGPYCLHGLNAIWLAGHGWYRIDARGNNENVQAEFCPPVERLAYPISHPGEADLSGIWAEPLPLIVRLLQNSHDCQTVRSQLPDVELFG